MGATIANSIYPEESANLVISRPRNQYLVKTTKEVQERYLEQDERGLGSQADVMVIVHVYRMDLYVKLD